MARSYWRLEVFGVDGDVTPLHIWQTVPNGGWSGGWANLPIDLLAGVQVVFQANTGVLGINTSGTPSSWADTNLGMMEGTSPSIAGLPDGSYVVAFQANTGVLGINTNGTPSSWADTNLGMMGGTSPSIASGVGGFGEDGSLPTIYVVAFQANTGVLGINTNGTPSSWDTNLGIMEGTSPSFPVLTLP